MFFTIFPLLFGLIIGSFLNVCIYRIPRKQSLLFPPSTCPVCGRRIRAFELIPVFSFVVLRGRCRGCYGRISGRYPLVELLTGLLFLGAFWCWGLTWETAKVWLFIGLIIPIAFIDLDFQLILDVISIPGIILGLVLSYPNFGNSFFGALLGFGIIALIILLSRGGMGWGDAKLMAMFGAFWGWKAVVYSLFLGSLFGSLIGITLLVMKKIERKTPIPFGPYLCLGVLVFLYIRNYWVF